MTAGILGWKLAIGRIIGTFGIALAVGQVISYWQKKERFLRRLVKINAVPSLAKELQQFAFEVGKKLATTPQGLTTEELAPGYEDKLFLLGEAGILDRNKEGLWHMPQTTDVSINTTSACFVLPTGDKSMSFGQRIVHLMRTAWDFFL